MTLSPTVVVAQSDEQVSCEVDGVAVLMSVHNGEYYKLDDIGTRIWQLMTSPTPVGEICDELVKEFDVEPNQCTADVKALLDDMLQRNLIRVV